ncbi:hypothetical protein DK419_09825 [Methylobacterium terrae]|uniref:Uncharacterized protein n=1 Tax=Methylobacterium terrae TaxID=2202827 RepID=A0A2U8WKB9_9HYPH|nr:hypothetical protein DK419_09825 [Methylobacterium terrae]
MVGPQRRPSADIIPFATARRPRAGGGAAVSQGIVSDGTVSHGTDPHAADAVRGTILLFTGVRYERLPDPAEPTRPAPERRCRR